MARFTAVASWWFLASGVVSSGSSFMIWFVVPKCCFFAAYSGFQRRIVLQPYQVVVPKNLPLPVCFAFEVRAVGSFHVLEIISFPYFILL